MAKANLSHYFKDPFLRIQGYLLDAADVLECVLWRSCALRKMEIREGSLVCTEEHITR